MKPSISSASLSSCKITTTLSPYFFTFIVFVFLLSILHENSVSCFMRQTLNRLQPESSEADNKQTILLETDIKKQVKLPYAIGEPHGDEEHQECDVFSGKWVYDESNRPPDKGYQHWRWEPHGCSLP
ncbi:hypothetical protein MKW98_022053, partial [Papaver atlanticum]